MLGASLALLSAAAFALNLATARRGMVTGTATQAMAISVPLGLACFLAATAITGERFRSSDFPPRAAAWMAGFGILHFVIGRYCNFLAGHAAGVNRVVPVIQLNIVVTLALAVFVLHGVVISIIGAMWVSIDTDVILDALAIPGGLAHALRWKV